MCSTALLVWPIPQRLLSKLTLNIPVLLKCYSYRFSRRDAFICQSISNDDCPRVQTSINLNLNTKTSRSRKCINLQMRVNSLRHICVGKLTIIGSDNGLSSGRRQAIIWTNAGIFLNGPLGANFSETLIEIHIFSFKNMHLKMSADIYSRPHCVKCWPMILICVRPLYANIHMPLHFLVVYKSVLINQVMPGNWRPIPESLVHNSLHHDDVIKRKQFPHYWPFVRGIHWSPVNSPHKGQWRGALIFSLICVWINDWVNNREPGDLRRYRGHDDVTAMITPLAC